MYQYTVSGTTGDVEGHCIVLGFPATARRPGSLRALSFAADAGEYGAEVFNYPAGGSPIATFTGNFDLPLGTVAAKK